MAPRPEGTLEPLSLQVSLRDTVVSCVTLSRQWTGGLLSFGPCGTYARWRIALQRTHIYDGFRPGACALRGSAKCWSTPHIRSRRGRP